MILGSRPQPLNSRERAEHAARRLRTARLCGQADALPALNTPHRLEDYLSVTFRKGSLL